MSRQPILEIRDISLKIDHRNILDHLSFSVNEGEYLSLIGPNGAGKTTLIKCLVRILRQWEGDVLLEGTSLRQYNQKDLAKRISYVPQTHQCSEVPFTVQEFVSMGRYPYLSPFASATREDRDAVEQALEMTNTTSFAYRLVGYLSGGEYQRVLIAAALAQGAKILLLDEPTTYLDYKYQLEVRRLLADINRTLGVTIISVTHDINDAVLSSNRALALKEGRKVFHGDIQDLLNDHVLETIYGTRFHFVQHSNNPLPIVVQDWCRP